MRKINVFGFFVRYFGFLKFVPLMALLFDAYLNLWAFVTNGGILDAIDDIEAEVSTWSGASIGTHKYGGIQFNYQGKELGHIHGNGILDMRFSRAIKAQLMNDRKISHHHVFPDSGWITFYIQNRQDGIYAVQLLKMAYVKRRAQQNSIPIIFHVDSQQNQR